MDDMESALDVLYFTGRLTNPDGTSVPDGVYAMNFSIFTEPADGEAIWSQWMDSVMVLKGTFRVPVEKKTLLSDYILKGEAYLEIQVGKEAAQARQKLDSSAFDTNSSPVFAPPILGTDGAFSFVAEIVPQQPLPTRDQLSISSVVGRLFVGEAPWGIGASNGYVYVSTLYRNFHVIDARDPARPTIVASLRLPPANAGPIRLAISGNYAYVLDNHTQAPSDQPSVGSGLMVVDVNEPTQPMLVSNWRYYDDMTHKLAVSADRAVVSTATGRLEVFDLEKGIYPVHAGQIMTGQGFPAVALAGHYAYAVTTGVTPDSESHLSVIDLSNVKQPTQVGSMTLKVRGALNVCTSDRYTAYVTGMLNDGQVVDISNPAQPAGVGQWSVVGVPGSLWLLGNYLYSIDEQADILQVVDVSDPNNPISYDFDIGIGEPGGGHLYGVVSDGYAYIVSAATGMLRIIRLPQIGA
jgi:hypothetical protein